MDASWKTIHAAREWGRWPSEEIVAALCRRWRPQARTGVHLLDLGCGAGAVTWFAAYEGWTITAIDGSEDAVTRCQALLSKNNLLDRANVFAADFTNPLPWPAATFDGVVDNLSLCHNPLPEIKSTLAEIHRVLKPGGLFITRAFGPGTSRETLCNSGNVTLASADEWTELLADFSDLEICTAHVDRPHAIERFTITCRRP